MTELSEAQFPHLKYGNISCPHDGGDPAPIRNEGGGWRWGREVGRAGVGWRDGEKMQTIVTE